VLLFKILFKNPKLGHFIYLFICSLFNNAFSSAAYMQYSIEWKDGKRIINKMDV
jgi:hypothetical protein